MVADNVECDSEMPSRSGVPFWRIDRFIELLSSDDQRAALLAVTFASGQGEFAGSLIPRLFEVIDRNIGGSSKSDAMLELLIGRTMVAISHLIHECAGEERAKHFERASKLAHELSRHASKEISHHANYALLVLHDKQ